MAALVLLGVIGVVLLFIWLIASSPTKAPLPAPVTLARRCGHDEEWAGLCDRCTTLLQTTRCPRCAPYPYVLPPCHQCDPRLSPYNRL